jgi:hypothetical protein
MDSIEHLRHATDEDASAAVADAGVSLPIEQVATLATVLAGMLGGPVTGDDIERALEGSYVALPLGSPAAVLGALQRTGAFESIVLRFDLRPAAPSTCAEALRLHPAFHRSILTSPRAAGWLVFGCGCRTSARSPAP